MKVKRKVAALLALAMVVTGQPTMILADGLNEQIEESTERTEDQEQLASDTNANPSIPENETSEDETKNEIPEDEREKLTVTATVEPSKRATVNSPETIMTGETLKFNVVVEDGYEIVSVDVDGEELEATEQSGSRYYYEAADVLMDPEITVLLEEILEFEYTETVGDLSFTLTAEEGVLPADTQVKIESLEDEGAVDTEEVKKEVLEKEGLSEEEAPVYGAYSISLTDEDGKKIPDKAAKKVTVSVSGIANLSETPELFDVGEANPIPTAVYKLNAVQNNSEEVDTLSEEPVQVKVTEKKAVKNSEAADEYTDVSFKLDNSFQRVAFAMNNAPKMLSVEGLETLANGEKIAVTILKEGSAEESYSLPVGLISKNVPTFPGYTFDKATVGENGDEVSFIGVYTIGGTRYEYYSINGNQAMDLNGRTIVLHYTADGYEISYSSNNESWGMPTGPAIAKAGDTVTFSAEPNLGYKLAAVTVDGKDVYEAGRETYTFEMPGNSIEIHAVYAKTDAFSVTYTPIGNTEENLDGGSEMPPLVGNGEELRIKINVDDVVPNYTDNKLLEYVIINGHMVELDGDGNANDLFDEMEITIRKNEEPRNVLKKYYYEITITNVKQDLEIEYFVRANSWIGEDHTITIREIGDGITLGTWDEESNAIVPVEEGQAFYMSSGSQRWFYVKTTPGYQAMMASGEGTNPDRVFTVWEAPFQSGHSDDPAHPRAIAEGYEYEFWYSGTSEDDRTVYLSTEPIKYHVKYDVDGGSGAPEDVNTYDILNNNQIVLASAEPTKDGFDFLGWSIGEHTYQPGDTINLDEAFIEYANHDNIFVFTAEWSEKGSTAGYTVNYYYETTIGNYPKEPESQEKFTGAVVGEFVLAVEKPRDGYTIDMKKSNPRGQVLQDGSLILKMYYAIDENDNDIPDNEETRYTLSYDGNGATSGTAPADEKHVENAEVTLAGAGTLGRDKALFLGWSQTQNGLITSQKAEEEAGIISSLTMPGDNEKVYAVWASDIDGDGTPDYKEGKYALIYNANGGDGGPETTEKIYINQQTVELATASEPTREKAVFLGWSENQIEEILEKAPTDGTIVTEVTFGEADKTVYAVWAADENKDGVIDADQTRVALRPYATSIYTGGESEYEGYDGSGFPALELELKYGDAFNGPEEQGARRVNNALVTEVNINGKWLPSAAGEGINKYLEAIYVYADEAGNYHRITNDTEYRPEGYIAVIAVKDTALEAFSGTEAQYVSENGFVRNNKTGRFVTISKSSDEGISSIGVRAYEEAVGNGNPKDYFVNIETSSLTIRQVNNDPDTSIRKMVDTEDEAIALNAQDLAAARPGEEGTVAFYTNGDEQRAAATEDDIRLLVDDVKDQDNRISLLEDKAFTATYGMTAEEAEAQGYDSQLKYLDLVDTGNGNAWVESATGTYVYWPYPEGTDKNTEFTLRHFVGLDRETQYDGADAVADAITDAKMEDEDYLQMEKTDEGIRFYTKGKLAFSPFILMWKTDDGNGNGGGSHDNDSTTGGSGTVADPYVVRLHGNWVHMDPNDIFKPISEPVPEGATPVTNPEWHQWKFILNNGTMLFNRWAYIRNPYAVGDQPREGWFYFNRDGIMQYGWYRDEATGKWYYAHRESDGMLGTLRYGWHHDDQDGKWYYLDPTTGEMLLGWRQIDGKWYYFNPYAPEVTWNYNEATGGWTYNGSASRPYGSMYQNEMTPDGYQVDGNGAWVQ